MSCQSQTVAAYCQYQIGSVEGISRQFNVVPAGGLEPPRLTTADFKSAASTVPPGGRGGGYSRRSSGRNALGPSHARRNVPLLQWPFDHPPGSSSCAAGQPMGDIQRAADQVLARLGRAERGVRRERDILHPRQRMISRQRLSCEHVERGVA